MTSPDLDGGIDEQDRDQTEAELAAAIAALLAAKAAGAPWLSLIQGSLSGIVTGYLRRSAYAMAVAAGMSSTEAAQAADDATDAVLGDVERHTASWLKISADDHAEKARQAAGQPGEPSGPKASPVQVPGQPMTPDDAKTAGDLIATSLATYARERVREDVAKKLGAQYKTWHCVVPETKVRGLISAVSKRPYVGDLISLHAGSPRGLTGASEFDGDLTVTPHHMVLTQCGWIRAEEVQIGDYLVRCHLVERATLGNPDVENPPASIVEIFRAANVARPAERMMRVSMDLDTQGLQSYVDVVTTDRKLRDRLKPPMTEPAEHFLFTQPDEALPSLLLALDLSEDSGFRLGTSSEFGGGLLVDGTLDLRVSAVIPSGGFVSDRDSRLNQDPNHDLRGYAVPLTDGVRGHTCEVVSANAYPDAVTLGLPLSDREGVRGPDLSKSSDIVNKEPPRLAGAHQYTCLPEPATDGLRAGCTELGGDLRRALAALVTLDEVVKVQRYEILESHGMSVLDCSTETSWYLANGLIVHNSRGDSRVRPAHAELAGQTKRLNKPFSVDGFNIMRPGDPEAPPELVLNCRCHLAFGVNPT